MRLRIIKKLLIIIFHAIYTMVKQNIHSWLIIVHSSLLICKLVIKLLNVLLEMPVITVFKTNLTVIYGSLLLNKIILNYYNKTTSK